MILSAILVCAGGRCHMVWISISEIYLLADWLKFFGEITWRITISSEIFCVRFQPELTKTKLKPWCSFKSYRKTCPSKILCSSSPNIGLDQMSFDICAYKTSFPGPFVCAPIIRLPICFFSKWIWIQRKTAKQSSEREKLWTFIILQQAPTTNFDT